MVIKGIESSDVGACVKHFAVNNQETERNWVNVEIDERTLREIYLPAFEAAVKKANVRSIMGAYICSVESIVVKIMNCSVRYCGKNGIMTV